MLRRVRVRNFMCLRDTTVELGPLTVFIGPNAAGKSAFFKALMALARLLRSPLRGPQRAEFEIGLGIGLDQVVWKGDEALPITFQVWFDGDAEEEAGYTLELRKVGAAWSVTRERMRLGEKWFDSAEQPFVHATERRGPISWQPPYPGTLSAVTVKYYGRDREAAPVIAPLRELAARIGVIWRYRPAAQETASVVYPPPRPEREGRITEVKIYVGPTGRGLAWVLRGLQGSDRKKFEAIEKKLHNLFPHIKSINFDEIGGGVRLAFATERSRKVLPAPLESDGVLMALFLLRRIYTLGPALTICLEEPESGTHPYLLEGRYDLLKGVASQKRPTRPGHLLIATHSPDLLASIKKRQEALDVVRVVEWDRESGTKIHRLRDLAHVDVLLKIFKGNVGELWWSGPLAACLPSATGTLGRENRRTWGRVKRAGPGLG